MKPKSKYWTIALSAVVLFLIIPLTGSTSLRTDLVGEWRFDEGYGTIAYDASDKENNGTITGATWTSAGKYGKALVFDGGDYVNCFDDTTEVLTRRELIEKENYELVSDYFNLINDNASDGDKTLTPVCFLSPLSPESMGQPSFNAKAKYGESLKCGANFFALGKNCKNSSAGINVSSSIRNWYASSNSCSDNLVSLNIFALCFLTSSSKNSGAKSPNLFEIEFNTNTEKEMPLFIKEEITTLASTTNLSGMLYLLENNLSYFLAKDSLTSFANSAACSSVNFDFETISLNLTSLESLSFNISLINIDNSSLGITLNSDSSSQGISTTNFGILTTCNNANENTYLNVCDKIIRCYGDESLYRQQGNLLLCNETLEGYLRSICPAKGGYWKVKVK